MRSFIFTDQQQLSSSNSLKQTRSATHLQKLKKKFIQSEETVKTQETISDVTDFTHQQSTQVPGYERLYNL